MAAALRTCSFSKPIRSFLFGVLSVCSLNAADIYGGSTSITGTVTGFWHVQTIGSQKWLIDPLGGAFHFVAPINFGFPKSTAGYAKYGTDANNYPCAFLPVVQPRMRLWGLNGVGGENTDRYLKTDYGGLSCWGTTDHYAPMQYRMPFVAYLQTSASAVFNKIWNNASNSLTQPPKGFNYGLNPYVGPGGYLTIGSASEADFYDSRLYTYFDYLLQNHEQMLDYLGAPSDVQKFLIGIQTDEADGVFSWTTGGDNCSAPNFCTGKEHPHGGLRVLRASPLQTASLLNDAIYPDQTVYIKALGLRNYLKSLYGTVAALNTAWGSSYSACDMEGAGDEFGSCGVQIIGEAYATANGSTTYTHILSQSTPSMYSVGIYVDGVMIAGDRGYNVWEGDVAATPGAPSRFWGPLVDTSVSTIDYSTGACTLTFHTGSADIIFVHGTGSTVTVKTGSNGQNGPKQHGTWVGAHVTISGTSNYNLSGVVASIVDSYTFTITNSATGAAELHGSIAFTDSSPPNGAAITVNYVKNGFTLGNGLMDEDGRHSNCIGANNDATNAKTLYLCDGTPLSVSAPWVTSQSLGTAYSGPFFSNDVGTEFTVAGSPIVVTQLGRWVAAGNTLTHNLKLVRASDSATLATATVDTSTATPGTYVYAPIAPVTLSAGASYYVTSGETSGTDSWYQGGSVTIAAGVATSVGGVYVSSDTYHPVSDVRGPTNFQYQTGTLPGWNNPQIATDLEAFLGQMATQYFSNMDTVFTSHFGSGASRSVLNLGPEPLIYWGSPSHRGVLAAAGAYLDAILMQTHMADSNQDAGLGVTLSQARLDWIRQWAGDKALINVDFIVAQPDSEMRDFGFSPDWTYFNTQADRGTAYLTIHQNLTSIAYTTGGIKPFVGTELFQWGDSGNETTNFGAVSLIDNAYDGHEDVSAPVACSAPLSSLTCGGDLYNSGDFITGFTAGNALWRASDGGTTSPSVTTTPASSITSTTASSGGTVTSDGGASVTSEGVCYALTANPTSPCTSDGTSGSFVSSLSGLSPNTTYHYRAFAINSVGRSYGSDLTFTTSAGALPSVTTSIASNISYTSATAGGVVLSNGDTAIIAEGTCYGLTMNPTSPCTSNGTVSPFTSALGGLSQGTTYHYRAFARNSAGTSYGEDLIFTTAKHGHLNFRVRAIHFH